MEPNVLVLHDSAVTLVIFTLAAIASDNEAVGNIKRAPQLVVRSHLTVLEVRRFAGW